MKRLLPLLLLLLSSTTAFSQVRLEWLNDTLYQATPQTSVPRFIIHGLPPHKVLDWSNAVLQPSARSCDFWSSIITTSNLSPRGNGDTAYCFVFSSQETDYWAEGRVSLRIGIGPDSSTQIDSFFVVPSAFYFKRTRPIPVSDLVVTPRTFSNQEQMQMELSIAPANGVRMQVGHINLMDTVLRGTLQSSLDFHIPLLSRGGLWSQTSPYAGTLISDEQVPLGKYDLMIRLDSGCAYFPSGVVVNTQPSSLPGRLAGNVYADRSANCQVDTVDRPVANAVVKAVGSTGSRYYGLTDLLGNYSVKVPYGTYHVSLAGRNGQIARPCASVQTVTVASGQSTASLSTMLDSARAGDARVGLGLSNLRPGRETVLAAGLDFEGDFDFTSRSVLEFDTLLSYVPNAAYERRIDSVVGNKVYFKPERGSVSAPGYLANLVMLSVPPDGSLVGRTVHFKLSRIGSADGNPANDTASYSVRIIGSYDPNDKQVSPESRRPGVEGDLTYTIRFQNTGTDTAFYVSVRDTLSPLLDLSTLHAFTSTHKAEYKLTGRVLEARFPFINLVDSNRNEPASHGQFSFKIKPVAGLALGQQIENKADIYFDYNAPVRTNTATFRVQQPTALVAAKQEVMQWVPNPAADRAELRMAAVPVGRLLAVDITGKTYVTGYNRTLIGIEVDLTQLKPGLYTFRFEGGAAVGQLMVVR